MARRAGATPVVVPVLVFSLLIGGIVGYFVRMSHERYVASPPAPPRSVAGPGAAGGPSIPMGSAPMGSGPMGSGGPGMGGRPPSGAMLLPRTVRALATLEKVQGKGLTPQQAQALLPVLKALQAADRLPDKDAEARLAEVDKALGEPQKQAIADLQPQRGPRGMGGPGGGGPPGAGPGGGPPGGPMMGGMMGGPSMDPERPFASERNKKALGDLIGLLEARAGK